MYGIARTDVEVGLSIGTKAREGNVCNNSEEATILGDSKTKVLLALRSGVRPGNSNSGWWLLNVARSRIELG